jgi:F-type H+-transporting ATPase subunit b
MFNVDFTFLFAAINLLIIYLVVRHFLFNRLGAFMEKRANGIAADLARSEELKAESEQLRLQNEQLLQAAADKQRAMLDDARVNAEKEYARIVEEGRKEAAHIKAETHSAAERELAEMKRSLASDMVDLTMEAASRVLEANMDNEANRALAARFLADDGAGVA